MAINDDGWKKIQDLFSDKGVHIGRLECKVLDALLGCERVVSRDHIVDHLYGDHEDGGPLNPEQIIVVEVHKLRKLLRLAGIPWKIVTHMTRGYQLKYIEGNDDE